MTILDSVYYVGMDVHKDTISLAVYEKSDPEMVMEKKINNDAGKIKQFFKALKKQGEVVACYEAGFCGFSLYRTLKEAGIRCVIAAPGLLPKKPGERIKTDRRDARSLAKNLQYGQVSEVHVPTEEDEAVRDYLRMCDDLKSDLKKNKQRLLHFLLRQGKTYRLGHYWTLKHRRWIKELVFENELFKETLEEYYYHITELEEKISRIKAKIDELVNREAYKRDVEKLKCLKGIESTTALAYVSEVGDFRRFAKAESFMAFLGLVPSESSSGMKHRKGGITKTGNSHLRRLLIEASWHYRIYKGSSKRLAQRRRGQPREIIAYADKAGRRLNKKYYRLLFEGKKAQVAVTAVARELAGFIWGMMRDHLN